ncbi:hypothetical protein [Halocynthiibacter namhaensis]|uniref:hypothetical protein n=1 Tax=Halocynthiibacter namhaensis TaxID=1290553 RepID=UPI00057918AD|nr:hypothetical protein [Halocynthiibacter namhaensis]
MANTVILVIGNVESWLSSGRSLPQDEALVFIDFHAFSAEALLKHRPTMILTPLTSLDFDALDIAERLQAFRFAGAFRILAPKLPNPEMIAREINYKAPNVDSEIIELSRLPEFKLVPS